MTIAVALKISEGLVLAADSAATMTIAYADGTESEITNVYPNTNKVFNVYKGLPIGVLTWGLGSIGVSSVERLMKDFRQQLLIAHTTPDGPVEPLDQQTYTIKDVADRLYRFVYEGWYVPQHQNRNDRSAMGFFVGGYSAGADLAEGYVISIENGGKCDGPVLRIEESASDRLMWWGQQEAIGRLVRGYGPSLVSTFIDDLGIETENIPGLLEIIDRKTISQMISAAMPMIDAIELTEFLVNLTINYVRFQPGHNTVGGPIEIAAISKYEGFKWIKRKHYFGRELNPEV